MNKRSRWIVIAVVAAAAAGGAVWGVRHGRATAGREAAEPLELPAPATATGRKPPSTRGPLIVVAGVVAAVLGVTGVAVHLHGSSDGLTDATMPYVPAFDPYAYGVTPAQPAWTPTAAPTPMTPPPTTPPPTSPPAPVPVGRVLPPDGSVIMPGDAGAEMTLSLVRILNPASPVDPDNPSAPALEPRLGYRLVSVTVRVENTGGVPFLTDVERHTWLVDKAGKAYPRNVELTEARQLHPATRLDPASWTGREVVFEVEGGAELTRFRLSTHPGAPGQTQDWRLS
ncbi:hypothetical protein [Actinoplanes sp. URMC 104]|uniref:hypothetical protein n=1 Tax=Actinoplanes sp. URMC 104 TaxID=3423409 RepID=UPI003F1DEB09